jgi:ribulose-5-phosphate 4-epimerase/fuculose-1-phosphate aldolase
MTPSQARALAAEASRALAAAGQGDMVWGHVAVRDPEDRGIWIKEPGWGLEEVLSERVQLVSFDAEVLEGRGAPHKECHIHLETMKALPDVTCTVHTHARAAIAFAALDTPLLPISHEGALFAGEDVPRYTATGGLVSTPELGKALAESLGSAPAVLLPSHGLAAAGSSVPAAVMHAVLLDRACALQLATRAAGAVRTYSDPAEARAKRAECWPETQLAAGYHYLFRKSQHAQSKDAAR